MTITINIENAAERQWISKYLEEFKKHPTAKIEVQEKNDATVWKSKVNAFLEFADKIAVTVDKIEIPNREERNAR